MQEHIDPIVFDAVEGKPLPDGHQAKIFAAGLPAWHPVRKLLSGGSQWLGRIDAVYAVLGLFSEVYSDTLAKANDEGLLRSAASPDIAVECEAFARICPDDVLYQGHRYKLHRLHAKARKAIEDVTAVIPPLRTVALGDFDLTFAKLVRAVRWS